MLDVQMLVVLALAQGQGVVLDKQARVNVFNADDVQVTFKDKDYVQVDPSAVMDQIGRDPRTRDLKLTREEILAVWIAKPHKEIDQMIMTATQRARSRR